MVLAKGIFALTGNDRIGPYNCSWRYPGRFATKDGLVCLEANQKAGAGCIYIEITVFLSNLTINLLMVLSKVAVNRG